MNNTAIAENFSLLAKLMDIHGDNSFKAKSYSSAAFTIDKLTIPLAELPVDKIFSIRGIGDAIGKKIVEQIETGQLSVLHEYLEKTPPGILEMLGIRDRSEENCHYLEGIGDRIFRRIIICLQ